jgi:UDP-2,3-diacylglucosamine pyrophosphatase LpxH
MNMLVIISDIHLGDGTTASSISPTAFDLFSSRLNETAYYASFRQDGTYRPIETLDLLLMGDILDPLHSTLWLDTAPGTLNYTRPWTDIHSPTFAGILSETTNAIIDVNRESLEILRRCANGQVVRISPANARGEPDHESRERIPINIRIHYMVGNHDWYYHLPGDAFDEIRKTVIESLGLCNDPGPFPYELKERPGLDELLQSYRVFARHGDCYDKFNFSREMGRNHATLGDVFTMDVCNRYPVEVQRRYGDQLPTGVIDSLRRITNVRPALATPLWISGQIRRYAESAALERELKKVWDDLCDQFLQLDFVRELDKAFKLDIVDVLELVLKISKRTSFKTLDDLVVWVRNKLHESERSLAENALQEPAFLDNSARFVVYGHTHHHEIVPLDSDGEPPNEQNQFYINSGTWRSYYDLAVKDPKEQKFVRYQTFTYLTFYKDGERSGRMFEAWSGAYV